MHEVAVSRIEVEAADGTPLVGDLLVPPDPVGAAVVAHPHPLYGGTRRDRVVAACCRGLVARGRATVRLDFRGAGESGGAHGGGPAERDDLRAALDAAVAAAPVGPVDLVGYSFGADVVLTVEDARVARWIVLAPPLAVFDADAFVAGPDPRPVHVLVAEHDAVAPPGRVSAATAGWSATTVEVIGGTDHLFGGAHARVEARLAEL